MNLWKMYTSGVKKQEEKEIKLVHIAESHQSIAGQITQITANNVIKET